MVKLWLLVTIVFGVVRFTGDPTTMLEEVGDAAYVTQLREQWGLDRPYYVQYAKYMWGLLQGDFGNSFQKSLAVRDIYLERLPMPVCHAPLLRDSAGTGPACFWSHRGLPSLCKRRVRNATR